MDINDESAAPAWLPKLRPPSDFASQQLFIKGEDWHNNAMLGWTPYPWDLYASGYKDAADVVIAALAAQKAPIDSVIYPLVFLYRQGLELKLKLILPLARRLAGVDGTTALSHSLRPLWTELRRHLQQVDPRDNDQELIALEDLIWQLDAVDPGSMAFRYPTNKHGEVMLQDLRHVNVRHLSEIMNSVFTMLDGIHSWLGEIEQYQNYQP